MPLGRLDRVEARLAAWGARDELRVAGLCHAFYGTDGFSEHLLPLEEREVLAAAIGRGSRVLLRELRPGILVRAHRERGRSLPGPVHRRTRSAARGTNCPSRSPRSTS
ncbi:DUF6817 domain-containing protein [Streptomyces sp. NPDC013457]|uniref:DUF6817 domain-containing protein n=1 Tax=Streptomyces sp. NPDC013457 TaxID=3364866 RepID=UPI0036FAFADE